MTTSVESLLLFISAVLLLHAASDTVIRGSKYGTTSHPFIGLLIYADCGSKLSYRDLSEHREKNYNSIILLYVNTIESEKTLAVCAISKQKQSIKFS